MNEKSDTILLSIHPHHVKNIMNGSKRFELRRKIPTHIKKIVIYATAPECKIVGICTVERIICDTPNELWPQVCGASGVQRTFFDEYFSGADKAYAIQLGRMSVISREIKLDHPRILKTPPQSFTYLNKSQQDWLEDCSDKMVSGGTKRIFIGGIHASGKSYLAKHIVSSYGYHCISASQLIREARGEVNHNKTVSDIDENQRLLLEGLKMTMKHSSHLAIDGHFSLIGQDGMPEKIPLQVFESINPELIIVANPPVSVIQDRLAQRETTIRLNTGLDEFQKYEVSYAKEVAAHLAIPIFFLDTSLVSATLHDQLKEELIRAN